MLNLKEKDIKITIINMSTGGKEIMMKKIKEGMMTISCQMETMSKKQRLFLKEPMKFWGRKVQ